MHTAVALVIAVALQQHVASTEAREAFERAAAAVDKFVDPGCVLYDRDTDSHWCEAQAAEPLRGRVASVDDLAALTRHRDPRVRTLALVHLFNLADPKLLPLIFALTTDTAPTYPAHTPVAMARFQPPVYRETPKTPQTVGDIAESMMRFYMERSGYSYTSAGTRNCPGFADYWRQRKDRNALAGWLWVQLDRSTRGTSPIPQDREQQFAALRAKVESLSGDERLWYSLFVGTGEGGERLFSGTETMAFASALGAERLMGVVLGREPALDPDLVPVGRPDSCGARDVGARMRQFVLEHAAQLLRPTDADRLLELPMANYAMWAVAAASLRPDRAREILTSAIAKIDPIMGWDQARMAAQLVLIGGDANVPYALDWFYARDRREPITNSQEAFLREAVDRGGTRGRALLARLIADQRFNRISLSALRYLILSINDWLPFPLVKDPYEYVAQEAATITRWCSLVRGSVSKWNP